MCDHNWVEEYYGYLCPDCGLFYPYGCAPWDWPDEWDGYDDWDTWEYEPEEDDE